MLHFEQKNYQQAAKEFQNAVRFGLDDADAYYMLAVSLRNQQNEKLALPFFQRASELKKSDTEIQFQYGLSLAYNEQIDMH